MNVVPLGNAAQRLEALADSPPDISEHLLQLLPVAVCVCAQDGAILRYNRCAAELWGREPRLSDTTERFCGSFRLYRVDGTPLPHDECPVADVLRTGVPVRNQEIVIERPDGSRAVALANIDAIRDSTGGIVGALNCLQEITQRNRLERELQDRERWHRELLDALPVAVYTTDARGRITYFNQAAVAFSGRRPTLGANEWCVTWRMYKPNGEPLPHDECPMAIALKEQREIRGAEAIAERPDGTRVRFRPYPTPLHDRTGTMIGAVNTLVDITEQEQAKRQERLLAAIVESSDDAIVSKNLEGTILSWNRSAERIFGYTADEAIGRAITMLIPEDRLDEEPTIIEHIRRGGRIEHYETVRRCKDGSLIDISLTVSPVKTAEGIVIGASKICRDITERKRAQEQQKLLTREMAHRVANLFAVARGIVSLSARFAQTPAELAAAIGGRLDALICAQDLTRPGLVGYGVEDTTLRALLQTLFSPYLDLKRPEDRERLAIRGLDVPITGKLVTSMALVLHELATNAAKYGALSEPEGRVRVEWHIENGALSLIWKEHGGPPLRGKPQREGFGSLLVRRTIEEQFEGQLSREWPSDGAIIRLSIPVDKLGASRDSVGVRA